MSETGPRSLLPIVEGVIEVAENTGPIGDPREDIAARVLEERLTKLSEVDLAFGFAALKSLADAYYIEARTRGLLK